MARRERVLPLTEEPAMFFRPALAARYGIEAALLLEWAHHLQCARGCERTVDSSGRHVVCFRWTARERLSRFGSIIKEKALRSRMELLTGLTAEGLPVTKRDGSPGAATGPKPDPQSAELLSEPLAPLWRFRLQGAGMDWYSVNYAVVEEGSKLFSTPLVDGQNDRDSRSKRPPVAVEMTADDGQNDRGDGHFDRDSRTRALSKEIQKASLLAGGQTGGEENQNADTAIGRAVAELAECGLDADAAIDLIERSRGGASQALVMTDNVRRLRAAGYRFNDPKAKGFVIAGTRGNWHRLSEEEVRIRVASQRGSQARPAGDGPNVPSARHQAAEKAMAARDRREDQAIDTLTDAQWETLLLRIKAIWAQRFDAPFPSDARGKLSVRGIAREILFPVTAGAGAR